MAVSFVSRETSRLLASYERLLLTWNKRINLIAKSDEGVFWERHIEDSLALAAHLPPNLDRFMDIGSGGGVPGIPITIATGIYVDLVESDRRKAAFLETVLATLQLEGAVWAERIENTSAPRTSCLVARALAPLDKLLVLAHPLVTGDAVAWFIKGERAAQEIDLAAKTWDMTVDLLPGASFQSSILRITKFSPRACRRG